MSKINSYRFYPKLMLRTPAFDYLCYQKPMEEVLNDSYFRTAICLASKSLYEAIEKKNFNANLLTDKQKLSLKLYFNRMCYRPTPFGLLSRFSVIDWHSENERFGKNTGSKFHISLDYHFLATSFENWLPNSQQKFILNNTIYVVGEEYRYLRYVDDGNDKREFFIESLESSSEIRKIVSFFCKSHTKEEFLNFMIKEFEIDSNESDSFARQFIEKQIILPEMAPNLTGKYYFDRILELDRAQHASFTNFTQLYEVRNIMNQLINTHQPFISKQLIHSINKLKVLGSNNSSKTPIYVNTEIANPQGDLSPADQEKILEGLNVIEKLTPFQDLPQLVNFASAYKLKFDQKWMPLLNVLDPECGIGYEPFAESNYHSPLLNNIFYGNSRDSSLPLDWTQSHSFLLDKWHSSGKTSPVIYITNEELENLPLKLSNTPVAPSLSVVFRKTGQYLFIEQAGGPSATALLGRFTPINSDIEKTARDIAEIEESANSDLVFAEIVHVSEPNLMNINRRSNIRKYEIPLLTVGGLPEENQIPLNDLWITVNGTEIVLWSEKLNKRVIPRLSSAFNYLRSNLPAFRLLCDLQYQGIRSNFNFDLSSFFPNLNFYPRVQCKETILSLASWHLTKAEINRLTLNIDCKKNLSEVSNFVKEKKWPLFISVNRQDHYIVINTRKNEDLVLFSKILKKPGEPVIKEFPFLNDNDNKILSPSYKPYVEQYIASLYHKSSIYQQGIKLCLRKPDKGLMENFMPGSRWSYFKIYCHPSRSNEILSKYILPLCKHCIDDGSLKQWFFVRYFDSSYHLRIRFNLNDFSFQKVIKEIAVKLTPLLNCRMISDFQLSVYERELERYDPFIIEAVETSFSCSSELVANFLRNHSIMSKSDLKIYQFALGSLDVILNCFKYSADDKIALYKVLFENLKDKFDFTEKFDSMIRETFRNIRVNLNEIFNGQIYEEFAVEDELSELKHSLYSISEITNTWILIKQTKLIADLIHMHINRIFAEAPRKNELIIYYILWRHFKSEKGRKNQNLRRSFANY